MTIKAWLRAEAKIRPDDADQFRMMADKFSELETEITTLRETLAFYRDEENYDLRHVVEGKWVCPIDEDKGQRARDALQKGGRDG